MDKHRVTPCIFGVLKLFFFAYANFSILLVGVKKRLNLKAAANPKEIKLSFESNFVYMR